MDQVADEQWEALQEMAQIPDLCDRAISMLHGAADDAYDGSTAMQAISEAEKLIGTLQKVNKLMSSIERDIEKFELRNRPELI
jgi:hypothetical protein